MFQLEHQLFREHRIVQTKEQRIEHSNTRPKPLFSRHVRENTVRVRESISCSASKTMGTQLSHRINMFKSAKWLAISESQVSFPPAQTCSIQHHSTSALILDTIQSVIHHAHRTTTFEFAQGADRPLCCGQ